MPHCTLQGKGGEHPKAVQPHVKHLPSSPPGNDNGDGYDDGGYGDRYADGYEASEAYEAALGGYGGARCCRVGASYRRVGAVRVDPATKPVGGNGRSMSRAGGALPQGPRASGGLQGCCKVVAGQLPLSLSLEHPHRSSQARAARGTQHAAHSRRGTGTGHGSTSTGPSTGTGTAAAAEGEGEGGA